MAGSDALARKMDSIGRKLKLVKIVDQDEFTNDVVLSLGDVWLAYDCS